MSQMTVLQSETLVGLCSEQQLLEIRSFHLVKLKVNIRLERRINHFCRPTAILHTNHQAAVDGVDISVSLLTSANLQIAIF